MALRAVGGEQRGAGFALVEILRLGPPARQSHHDREREQSASDHRPLLRRSSVHFRPCQQARLKHPAQHPFPAQYSNGFQPSPKSLLPVLKVRHFVKSAKCMVFSQF